MQSVAGRATLLAFGLFFVFSTVVAILLQVMPGPHGHLDFLVIGAVATFAAMLVLFLILTTTWIKTPNVFYKRRDNHHS